mgnify:CR=1 FL=1
MVNPRDLRDRLRIIDRPGLDNLLVCVLNYSIFNRKVKKIYSSRWFFSSFSTAARHSGVKRPMRSSHEKKFHPVKPYRGEIYNAFITEGEGQLREYWETFRIREYLHLEGYDNRMMASLIESVKVMGEDRLEVVWKFGHTFS